MAAIVGMGRKLANNWHPDKIKRFIRDWDEGLDPEAMEERYGGKPTRIAVALRAAGYTLVSRNAPVAKPAAAPATTRHPWRDKDR